MGQSQLGKRDLEMKLHSVSQSDRYILIFYDTCWDVVDTHRSFDYGLYSRN